MRRHEQRISKRMVAFSLARLMQRRRQIRMEFHVKRNAYFERLRILNLQRIALSHALAMQAMRSRIKVHSIALPHPLKSSVVSLLRCDDDGSYYRDFVERRVPQLVAIPPRQRAS